VRLNRTVPQERRKEGRKKGKPEVIDDGSEIALLETKLIFSKLENLSMKNVQ
jgi:hypothetical protein